MQRFRAIIFVMSVFVASNIVIVTYLTLSSIEFHTDLSESVLNRFHLHHKLVNKTYFSQFQSLKNFVTQRSVATRYYKTKGNYFRITLHETFVYSKFNITEPNFVTEDARCLFYLDGSNAEVLGIPSNDKLIGEIYTVKNGTYNTDYDCGYKSNASSVLEKRAVKTVDWYYALVPLIVPDGWSFQHFLDGTLPKIVQSLDYILQPRAKLLLPLPRDSIVTEFLDMLNISDKVVYTKMKNVTVGADHLIFSCITPPLHPYLWQRARVLLGGSEILQQPREKANIVIITRHGCFNCGRRLLNRAALGKALKSKYAYNNVVIFRGPYKLNYTLHLFRATSFVIGVHGGGMYNINFCPKGTTVIEIMPTFSNGSVLAAADKIIWFQSIMLDHHYWRLPTEPENKNGDVIVNITLVESIIDKVLK